MATASYGRSAGVRSPVRTPDRASLLAPMWARMRGGWLDRELATGVEPWRTPVHSARSLQITGVRARRSLAKSLDQLIRRAQTSRPAAMSTVVPLDRRAVLGARVQVEALAQRLRDGAPVSTRGVAALRDLLCDGSGPIYSPVSGEALGRVLASIRDSLDVVD